MEDYKAIYATLLWEGHKCDRNLQNSQLKIEEMYVFLHTATITKLKA